MPLVTLRTRFGVRAQAMFLCAFIWALVGLGVLTSVAPAPPGTFHGEVPFWLSVSLWFGAALLAAITAPMRKWSALGLSILLIAPALRFLSYSTAWLLFETGNGGYERGWYSAAVYLALLGLVYIAARIPAPALPPERLAIHDVP